MVIRRLPRPHRVVDGGVIVAHPETGTPVVLRGAAAVVWSLLEQWQEEDAILASAAATNPEVDTDERERDVRVSIALLAEAGLIERA